MSALLFPSIAIFLCAGDGSRRIVVRFYLDMVQVLPVLVPPCTGFTHFNRDVDDQPRDPVHNISQEAERLGRNLIFKVSVTLVDEWIEFQCARMGVVVPGTGS